MKRLSVALLLCGALSVANTIQAQSSTTPSRFTVSAGIGLFPTYYRASEHTGVPPLSLRLGVDVTKSFALSSYLGYSTTTAKPAYFSEKFGTYITNKTLVMGLRAELKREFTDRVSAYAGSMLACSRADVKEYSTATNALMIRSTDAPTPFDPNEKKCKLTYSAFVGGTVQLTKRLNLYGELGYGISIANLGLTVRI